MSRNGDVNLTKGGKAGFFQGSKKGKIKTEAEPKTLTLSIEKTN